MISDMMQEWLPLRFNDHDDAYRYRGIEVLVRVIRIECHAIPPMARLPNPLPQRAPKPRASARDNSSSSRPECLLQVLLM